MKLTLHKSQVHSYSVMQWWACSSLMSLPLPAEMVCESRERIVLLLVFIFSLGFLIFWFHTKLSPSHFTTKLRSCHNNARVHHAKYHFFQANTYISLSKFSFRNSSLSILISDKWFKRHCDNDDRSSFFIRSVSKMTFHHCYLSTQNNSNIWKSGIRFLSWIKRCINVLLDSSPCFSST